MTNQSAGKLFRELRTKQNISLKEAIKDIDELSPSRLSHWESDSSNIPLYKLDQLLYNIHVLPTEFAELLGLRFINTVTLKTQDAFIANDVNELHNLATNQLNKYQKFQDNNELYLSALTCNFYFQKSGKNIFPDKLKTKITDQLSKTSLWSQYYITAFGNALNLLNPKDIYKIAQSLANNFDFTKNSGLENNIYASLVLLNATLILSIRSPNLAQKLFIQIKDLKTNSFDVYSNFYKKFTFYILNYQLFKKEKDLKLAKNLIEIFNFIDRADIAEELEDILSKVQNSSK